MSASLIGCFAEHPKGHPEGLSSCWMIINEYCLVYTVTDIFKIMDLGAYRFADIGGWLPPNNMRNHGGHLIAPTPQAPVRNRQTRDVANAKVRIG